jgi:hypothetical protein
MRWTESKNSVILSVVHRCQKHLELTNMAAIGFKLVKFGIEINTQMHMCSCAHTYYSWNIVRKLKISNMEMVQICDVICDKFNADRIYI